MNYIVDQKGHERKRKAKGGLANGIVLGSATVLAATTLGTSSVSADGVTVVPEAPAAELVASTETSVSSAVVEVPTETVEVSTVEEVSAIDTIAPISEFSTQPSESPSDVEKTTSVSESIAPVIETPAAAPLKSETTNASEDLPEDTEIITNPESGYKESADGNTITVTSDELNDAINDAKAEGVVVRQNPRVVSVGTATTPEEAAALAREIVDKQAEDVAKLREARASLSQAKTEAVAKQGTDGAAVETVKQNLIYSKEPQAIAETIGNSVAKQTHSDHENFTVQDGTKLTTVYSNLQNSYYDGRLLSKIEIDRVVHVKDKSTIDVVIWNDPTVGRTVNDDKSNEPFYTDEVIRFYDADGKQISFSQEKPAAIALNSLNAHKLTADHVTWGSIEYVSDYNFRIVPIIGSSITEQNGEVYSLNDNDYKIHGSKYDNNQWDGNGETRQPLFYYGSAIGLLESGNEIRYSTGNKIGGSQWFAINTDIPALGVITNPNVSYTLYSYDYKEKTVETPPPAPEAPKGDVTVEYKDEAGNTLSPKVTDTPTTEVGKDYDTTEHRKPTISTDNKTYELVRTDGPEKGKVVEGNTNIVYIYQEVKGDVLVKYQDTQGNTLKDDVVDTPASPVGSDYDTKDNKPATITLTDGSVYRIVENLTKGTEAGKVAKGTTVITYIYQPVLGNVTVEHKDDKGNPLKPKEVDTPDTTVGKDYDTTDRRTPTIVTPDGKTYDLIKTEGKETGKVVEGNTNVVYIYQEAKGTVVVRYQDTLGNTIKDQVTDTPATSTGVAYDTTDNKPQIITTDSGASYRINTGYTKGAETGKVVRGETVITYVYEQILGDVLVKYQDRKGGQVIPDVVDTPTTSTGKSYDTTDHKPQVIELANGATFRLVPNLTKGTEKGKVVEGTTTIIYIYDEILGDVVVDYQNKANGEIISPRETDTPLTSTGTNYDTTDNKPVTIVTPDGRTFRIDPNVTKGIEVGKVVEGRTTVTYLYDELKGNVIVHYQNEEGKTIRKDVYDLKDSSTNRDYDTTDNKPVTIVTDEGRTYDIVLDKTKGNETGKTVVGDTHVTYTYKEILGDVVVHYEDEGGKVIHPEAFDTKQSSTGKAYDTTDLKHAAVFHDGSVYNIIVTKTKGVEKGLVARGTTHVTYVYKVEEPVSKKVVNNEAGRNIEGKTMLPGDLLVNRILIDNDQNKGLVGLTDADKEVGLFIVENYPEKFTEPVLEAVRIVYAGTDKVADIKTTTVLYNSITEAPQAIQERLKAQGYELKEGDKFSLTTSVDNKAYTENFALKGIQLELVFPTRVLKAAEASEFENVALVGDFNGVAITNVAINRVPKIDPKKDVFTTLADGMKNENSIDGKTAKVGDVMTFKFKGSFIPGDRGTELTSYGHNDTLSKLLRYDGNFKYFSDIETPLTNGTLLKAGEEITRYATQVIEHNEDGTTTVKFRLTDEFLKLLGDKSAFQFSKYVQATVIAEGLIENTQDEIINETVYSSNKVTVNVVPEPKPEPTPVPNPTPTPTPVPVTPAPVPVSAATPPYQPLLPNTGDGDEVLGILGAMTMIAATSLGVIVNKRKVTDNDRKTN